MLCALHRGANQASYSPCGLAGFEPASPVPIDNRNAPARAGDWLCCATLAKLGRYLQEICLIATAAHGSLQTTSPSLRTSQPTRTLSRPVRSAAKAVPAIPIARPKPNPRRNPLNLRIGHPSSLLRIKRPSRDSLSL